MNDEERARFVELKLQVLDEWVPPDQAWLLALVERQQARIEELEAFPEYVGNLLAIWKRPRADTPTGAALHFTELDRAVALLEETLEQYRAKEVEGRVKQPAARCLEPHSMWGVCGIPEDAHEDAFVEFKGTRFWHQFKGRVGHEQ